LFPLALGLLWTGCLDTPTEITQTFLRPQDTIASYWHSMIEGRHFAALECFADSRPSDVMQMMALPDLVELRCIDFRIADRGRGAVDVAYTVQYRTQMGEDLAAFRTGDRLILTQRGWKISTPLLMPHTGT
jgi:hypothetical protein